MSKRLLVFLGIGLVVAGIAAALIYYLHVGSHLDLKVEIIKIRTGKIDDNNCAALIDFRVENISDVQFKTREIAVNAEQASGEKIEGDPIARKDIQQLLQYNRFFGQQYNPALAGGDTIKPREKVDRTLAIRFDVPLEQLDKAKQLRLHMQDTTGAEFETVKPLTPH
jgi:hypothetical protein